MKSNGMVKYEPVKLQFKLIFILGKLDAFDHYESTEFEVNRPTINRHVGMTIQFG